MPSWKPDCLKASVALTHLSHTIQSTGIVQDQYENDLENKIKSQNRSDISFERKYGKQKFESRLETPKPLSFQNATSKIAIQKGYSKVELIRINSSQFGLTIAGGTDKDTRPRICDLKPGSIAHRSDELQIGDMIISINGIKTLGLKHEEIINLIKNAGDTLVLEFEYNLPPWPIHPQLAVRSQTVQVQLEKEFNSYGFTIRGGSNFEKSKSRPLIITNIRAGGPADKEGTLKIGDRILAINGINVTNSTLQDAYMIIKECRGLAFFLIEYDSAIVDSIKNSSGPLLIEIEKSPGSSIGIRLIDRRNSITGKNQILVESVKPASIADRCGAIYVGDQIVSIDDVSFENISLSEAHQILKNCTGEFCRVEIIPQCQFMRSDESYKNSFTDEEKDSKYLENQNFVCHSETIETILNAYEDGTFGFTLQAPKTITLNNNFPTIGYIESNTPAEKCGVLQAGDRILHVNNISLKGVSLENARNIIKGCGIKLKLGIEFDVADSISLTSGIFQVKLLKKKLPLGILFENSDNCKSDYPVISSIIKGSVAYRSGMLFPGDQILFINDVCLKSKSLSEVSDILSKAQDLVSIKVKKNDQTYDSNGEHLIYTVEMHRNGGPLGITISGSEDLEEPIFVSGLTAGGLAERTKTIQIGDTIIAINDTWLKGKSLKEAIELLQNGEDLVRLKIIRQINKNPKSNFKGFILNNKDECKNNECLESQFSENSRPNKKSLSLDSINAVEKELDEVLKDLELNSSELNEQFENEQIHNSIFLPFTIQNENETKSLEMLNLPFETNEILFEDCSTCQECSSIPSTVKIPNQYTIQRNNIISTYEICKQCNRTNLLVLDENNTSSKINESKNSKLDNKLMNEKILQKNMDDIKQNFMERSALNKSIDHVQYNGFKERIREEDKVDKLPPVPPSSTTHNGSIRRKNQLNSINSNKVKKTKNFSPNVLENEVNENSTNKSNKEYTTKDTSGLINIIHTENSKITNNNINEHNNSIIKNQNCMKSVNLKFETETIEVFLEKDHNYKDFGFYIAESINHKCLYISKIRESGSIDRNVELKPYLKIFKVNGIDFSNIDLVTGNRILFNEYCSSSKGIVIELSKFPIKDDVNTSSDSISLNQSNRPTAL